MELIGHKDKSDLQLIRDKFSGVLIWRMVCWFGFAAFQINPNFTID
jgi:hypothetical protein